MTQAFRLQLDVASWAAATASRRDLGPLLEARAFQGRPVAAQCGRPVRLQTLQDGRAPADVMSFLPGALVLNGRAAAVLGPLLDGRGELLPTTGREGLQLFGCTRVLDGLLDEEASRGTRLVSGGWMSLRDVVLRGDVPEGETVFRLAELPVALFATAAVKDAVESAGLTGIVWGPVGAQDHG